MQHVQVTRAPGGDVIATHREDEDSSTETVTTADSLQGLQMLPTPAAGITTIYSEGEAESAPGGIVEMGHHSPENTSAAVHGEDARAETTDEARPDSEQTALCR